MSNRITSTGRRLAVLFAFLALFASVALPAAGA